MAGTPQPHDPYVDHVFDRYPEPVRERLLSLRSLIYDVAQSTPGVGDLQETLKWGQPSYLTPETSSGTTVRIDQVKGEPHTYAIYTSCQTPLVADFRRAHGDAFRYDKNRGIVFDVADDVDEQPIREFVADALTYHLIKRERA
jgi:hypothetical protein